MKHEAEYLRIALKALACCEAWGLEVVPGTELKWEDDVPDARNTIFVNDRNGYSLAAMRFKTDAYRVQTLMGDRLMPGWEVYLPTWDSGDPSVGMEACLYLDMDAGPHEVVRWAVDAALEIAQWFLREEVNNACRDAGEYLSFEDDKEWEEV